MIEIFENQDEQFGISTFNTTLMALLNNDGHESFINYSNYSIGSRVHIYSSRRDINEEPFAQCGDCLNIFVVHGLHNENFLPPKDRVFDEIWCFSDTAQKYLIKRGYKSVKQVPQIIDDQFWKTKNVPNGNVLVIDPRNWGFYTNQIIPKLAKMPFIGLRVVSEMISPEDLLEEIEHSSTVIAYGRSAMESILCERPTIIFGHNGGDGLVTLENIDSLMKTNLSGWTKSQPIDLGDELDKAFDMKKADLKKLRSEIIKRVGNSLINANYYI